MSRQGAVPEFDLSSAGPGPNLRSLTDLSAGTSFVVQCQRDHDCPGCHRKGGALADRDSEFRERDAETDAPRT